MLCVAARHNQPTNHSSLFWAPQQQPLLVGSHSRVQRHTQHSPGPHAKISHPPPFHLISFVFVIIILCLILGRPILFHFCFSIIEYNPCITNHINHVGRWEADVYVLPLPWGLRDLWANRLLELVEKWAGVPVEQTVMYGLREYTDGARLLTHVDRRLTHAVSLIVNVAQGNLTEPWPVEVQDHADRLHEVIMQPGDIVYYESAKALHGRNRPLPGGYYANLFTHYRPTGVGTKWYSQENPPGTPEPVLDSPDANCRLEPFGTTDLNGAQLGIVKKVVCDDPRLGGNISPTLFQAKSADDLVKWWRITDPAHPRTVITGSKALSD